ncbi:Glucan endo-1,3-beta-glucosidase 11 [Apostasia shenzhenica]|uniref:glucan endo-1,3-beta-D-glucosidase n=1 Tax=Apostasia shenzhenica TaxID=1088818 RepID=A0A2I0AWZ3_9ASPA|nr:Glucan endo-1,3-beta-glucosidase 11 [Apostasia shenzhenica]
MSDRSIFFRLLSLLLLLRHFLLAGATSASLVGVNYGLLGNNLPSPNKVTPLLRSIGVGRVKLYDADPSVLRAFANTGVELIIGLPDRCVDKVRDPDGALAWTRANVQAYLPGTKIAAITVGNEILTGNDTSLAQSLLPAMESLHSALTTLGLDRQIVVTTPHSIAILASSYPPSSGAFRRDLIPQICPILNFLSRTGSSLLINAYPYFAYNSDRGNISLDYVLFQPNAGVVDPKSGLRYGNMLHAQVDAVYAAIAAVGGPKGLEVRVSETGWPSNGGDGEVGATPENAAKYNGNLMKLVAEEKGTPMRPGTHLRVYVFALFNENLKPGLVSERYYGLFKPDGSPAYNLDITVPLDNSTGVPSNGGGGGGSGVRGGGDDDNSSSGYYSISSATGRWTRLRRAAAAAAAAIVTAVMSTE